MKKEDLQEQNGQMTAREALAQCGFMYVRDPKYGGGRAHWDCSDANGPMRLIALAQLNMIASVTEPSTDQGDIAVAALAARAAQEKAKGGEQ